MKCVLAVAVVAAFVAVTYGAPVATTEVDWVAIEGKVNQIESTVQAAVQQINTVAKRDNAAVGADIERKLGAKAVEARSVLDQARADINGRSLTLATAKVHLDNLRRILGAAQEDIRADVAKLSASAQAQIREILFTKLSQVERLASELYALLPEAATFAVVWTAVEGKVNQIESAVQAAVQQINTIAKRDNAAV